MENKLINIPSTINDPKYRYQMPKMNLKIQSKENGIKTNIVNLADVAKYLRTQPEYILKFFAYQKGTQIILKEVGKNNKNFIINGQFTYEQMIKILDKFIEKYICCPKCKYPQINMSIVDGKIKGKCDSCPYNGELDNKHKLKNFILKHPPTNLQKIALQQIPKSKLQEKKQQVKKNNKQQIQTFILHKFKGKQIQFETQEIADLVINLKKFVTEKIKDDIDIISALMVSQLKPLGLKKPIYAYAIFNACFSINIAKQAHQIAPLYKNLMKKLVTGNVQIETLINLQHMILQANKQKNLNKFISTIMMKLYEQDIFSKQFIINWSKRQIQNMDKNYLYLQSRDEQFLKMASDFIEYLKNEDQQETQQN